jgi:hypothetical protein
MFISMYKYVYVCICMYLYIYIYTYLNTYTHIHIHINKHRVPTRIPEGFPRLFGGAFDKEESRDNIVSNNSTVVSMY